MGWRATKEEIMETSRKCQRSDLLKKQRERKVSLAVQKKTDFGQTAQAKSKKPDWNSRSALNQ
jgi:hypothetical protein